MKRVIIGLMFVMACTVARADTLNIGDSLKKIPAVNQGVAFSLIDSKVNYLSTFDVLKWKGLTLEAGSAYDAEKTGIKAVIVASYDIANMKKLGVTMPVLDLLDLRVGAYAGIGRIEAGTVPVMRGNNEYDAGLSVTAISVKF